MGHGLGPRLMVAAALVILICHPWSSLPGLPAKSLPFFILGFQKCAKIVYVINVRKILYVIAARSGAEEYLADKAKNEVLPISQRAEAPAFRSVRCFTWHYSKDSPTRAIIFYSILSKCLRHH